MLTLHEIAGSRYLLFRGLTDAGFATDRAALAVDVLLGPESDDDDQATEEWHPEFPATYEPSEEDYEDYVTWADRLELPPWPVTDDVSDCDVMTVLGCVG